MPSLSSQDVAGLAQNLAQQNQDANLPPLPPGAIGYIHPLPRDDRSLDNVTAAVLGAESGGRQFDSQGNVLVSPKGARGVGQLMPGTAADLHVNPDIVSQNKEGARKYLDQMYNRYGNWDDALAAYNWGPGNVDKWIKGGRSDSAIPAATKNYVQSVLRGAGLSQNAPSAIVASKRQMTSQDIDDLAKQLKASPAAIPPEDVQVPTLVPYMGIPAAGEPGMGPESQEALADENKAFLEGAVRDSARIVAGPFQAGLQQVAPAYAQALTQHINNIEDSFEAAKKYPGMAAVGGLVGSTLTVLAASGALGALGVRGALAEATKTVPLWLKGGGIGALMGATDYQRDPDKSSRVLDTLFGFAGGVLPATVAQGLIATSRLVANQATYQRVLKWIKDAAGDVTPATSRILGNFSARMEQVWRENNDIYALRNAAGQTIPGFDRDAVRRGINQGVETSEKGAGVPRTPEVEATLRRFNRLTGNDQDDAKRTAHEASVAQYNKDLEDWDRKYNTFSIGGVKVNVGPGVREQILRDQIARGNIPAPPANPGEYASSPLTPMQLSIGRKVLNRTLVRTQDRATEHQLGQMRQVLDQELKDAAERHGGNSIEFARQMDRADTFYRDNIAPIDKMFGRRWRELTPAKFFNRVVKIVENKQEDTSDIAKLKQYMGPAAQHDLVKAVAYRMVTRLTKQGEGATVAYIRDHSNNLRALLDKDDFERLEGMAKVADNVLSKPKGHSGIMNYLLIHPHPYGGAFMAYEGVRHGSPGLIAGGAALYAGPLLLNRVYLALSHAYETRVGQLLFKQAATVKPGSPEMDRLVSKIESRALGLSAVGGQQAGAITQ